ncbi:hypothetical protein [Streptomyces sp. Ru87]|uniref:hypothetical protein n=1 Tax=Streptomyces sp. Ru87 TaxID=2044307 RepID=UPI000BF54901|nr:hypothetical protein [Streptomyces sp. Ru87]PGH49692.1 hypothetical protein CRI70_16170 [Streptomyces sp. Ru87]
MIETIGLLSLGLLNLVIIGVAFISRIHPNIKAGLHSMVCVSYAALYLNDDDTDHLGIAVLHAMAVAMWLTHAWRRRIERREQHG